MRNLVGYLVGPGKANEHTEPTMVAAWGTLPEEFVDVEWNDPDWGPGEVSRLAQQLNRPMVKKRVENELPEDRAWVMHVTMSLEPGSTLDYEQWGKVATDYIKHMELDDSGGKAPCRWVAFHHGLSAGQDDTTGGQDHIHLAVMMIREDGTWASTWQNQRRSQWARRQIESDHQLTPVEQAAQVRDRIPYSRIDAARSGRGVAPERDRLRTAMTSALTQADSEADYIRRLWASGVLTRPYFAPGSNEVVTGYGVALRPTDGSKPYFQAAGDVHTSLRLPAVRRRFPDTVEGAQAAALLWRAGTAVKGPAPKPDPNRAPQRTVGRAAKELAEVHRLVKELPQEEVDRWADLAWDTSGIWATVARTLEPSGLGAITAAAEATRRDATKVSERAGASDAGRRPFTVGTARAARLIAQSWRDDELGWLALIEQLAHTTTAIVQTRTARQNTSDAGYLAERALKGADAARKALVSYQNQRGRPEAADRSPEHGQEPSRRGPGQGVDRGHDSGR